MKKTSLVTIILTLSFFWLVTLISYNFNAPYRVVEQFIIEAKQNINESTHIIDEIIWEKIKDESVHRVIRKEIDWKDFKDIIHKHKDNQIIIGPKYKFYYKYKKFSKKYTDIYVYIYDNFGEEVYSKRLLMCKINGNWKIVGEDKYY